MDNKESFIPSTKNRKLKGVIEDKDSINFMKELIKKEEFEEECYDGYYNTTNV